MATNGNSRLAQMQMRFQQKQIQEREQRRLELSGGNLAPTNGNADEQSLSAKSVGNGKVRQMFDERRRGAGIDRGNPLKPITTTTTTGSRTAPTATNVTAPKASIKPAVANRRPTQGPPSKRVTGPQPKTVPRKVAPELNGNGNSPSNRLNTKNFHELDNLDDETFPKTFSTLSLCSESGIGNRTGDRNNNATSIGRDQLSRGPSPISIKLNPVVTRKSPSNVGIKMNGGTTNVNSNATSTAIKSAGNKNSVKNPPATKMTSPGAENVRLSTISAGPPPSGMLTCKFCGRHFIDERLPRHEVVCAKMASKKRKVFDASKQRIQGTDAEKVLKKRTPNKPTYMSAAAATGLKPPPGSAITKNNWRKKHEEFIAAIRAAKKVQAHLARGGKLSDLPPPPPSENPDYIQCPHCLRRFNQAAAERHIPRCATMLHNKPKPGGRGANVPQRRR